MNSVILVGTVDKEPELRYTQNGKAVLNFRLSVGSGRSNKDTGKEYSDWFTIVCWGELGERVGATLNKGDKAFVQGRLKNESYEGQDGKKRYVTKIDASTVDTFPAQGGGDGGSETRESGPEDFPD